MPFFATPGEVGVLHYPPDLIHDIREMKHYPAEKRVLLTTGSQGEPMATRIKGLRIEDRSLPNNLRKIYDGRSSILERGKTKDDDGNTNTRALRI